MTKNNQQQHPILSITKKSKDFDLSEDKFCKRQEIKVTLNGAFTIMELSILDLDNIGSITRQRKDATSLIERRSIGGKMRQRVIKG